MSPEVELMRKRILADYERDVFRSLDGTVDESEPLGQFSNQLFSNM